MVVCVLAHTKVVIHIKESANVYTKESQRRRPFVCMVSVGNTCSDLACICEGDIQKGVGVEVEGLKLK